MKLLENRFFDKEINGNKAVEHTAKREKTKPKSVVLARRNVFGLDRGAGGETLGPEGRRSMMSLPNRVFICLLRIYSREHIWQRVLDNVDSHFQHSFTGWILPGWWKLLIDPEQGRSVRSERSDSSRLVMAPRTPSRLLPSRH